jgi:DNA-directed RNA polymerase alpha subunit
VKKNEDDVLAFKGMGEKGVQEIKKALKKLDLGLKEQN